MNIAHIRSMDLNLLTVAGALYRNMNVSRAAAELGLSQSAVSHALTRLRDHFKDPLFVRTAKGMATTSYARKIQPHIIDLLQRAEILITQKEGFDPLTTAARITIASTDYFEILVMPELQAILRKEAPLLQVSLRPTRGELPKRDLEDGRIDLAVAAFYRDVPEGFYQSRIFVDRFACAVGARHPLFKAKELSLDEYYEAKHALITLQGDFRDLGPKSRARDIVYGSYSFTGMAWVLQDSQLLLTAPKLLIGRYQEYFPLRSWDCPVDKGVIEMRMVWQQQTHEDPLHMWIRKRIKEICSRVG